MRNIASLVLVPFSRVCNELTLTLIIACHVSSPQQQLVDQSPAHVQFNGELQLQFARVSSMHLSCMTMYRVCKFVAFMLGDDQPCAKHALVNSVPAYFCTLLPSMQTHLLDNSGGWYAWGLKYKLADGTLPNTRQQLTAVFARIIGIFRRHRAPIKVQLNINANNGEGNFMQF
jgi:hypothetical protein